MVSRHGSSRNGSWQLFPTFGETGCEQQSRGATASAAAFDAAYRTAAAPGSAPRQRRSASNRRSGRAGNHEKRMSRHPELSGNERPHCRPSWGGGTTVLRPRFMISYAAGVIIALGGIALQFVPTRSRGGARELFLDWHQREHGWPIQWLRIVSLGDGQAGHPAAFGTTCHYRVGWLLFDVLCVAALVIVAAACCERRFRAGLKVWQITLRELVVISALIAVGAWNVARMHSASTMERAYAEEHTTSGLLFGWSPASPQILGRRFPAPKSFETLSAVLLYDCEAPGARRALHAARGVVNRVTVFELNGSCVDNRVVEALGPQDYCTELDVSESKISYEALYALKQWRSLSVLRINYTRLGDEALEVLAGCSRLEDLSASRTRITDRGLSYLSRSQQLQRLDVSDTRISARGVQFLVGLSSLSELNLSHTLVDDSACVFLEQLPNLQLLDVSHTRISAAGIERLGRCEKLRVALLYGLRIDRSKWPELERRMPVVLLRH